MQENSELKCLQILFLDIIFWLFLFPHAVCHLNASCDSLGQNRTEHAVVHIKCGTLFLMTTTLGVSQEISWQNVQLTLTVYMLYLV